MANTIESDGTTLVVNEKATVDEFVSLTSRKLENDSIVIRISRIFLEKNDDVFAEPVKADGYELLEQFASIHVSPEHARAFAMAILDSVSE